MITSLNVCWHGEFSNILVSVNSWLKATSINPFSRVLFYMSRRLSKKKNHQQIIICLLSVRQNLNGKIRKSRGQNILPFDNIYKKD